MMTRHQRHSQGRPASHCISVGRGGGVDWQNPTTAGRQRVLTSLLGANPLHQEASDVDMPEQIPACQQASGHMPAASLGVSGIRTHSTCSTVSAKSALQGTIVEVYLRLAKRWLTSTASQNGQKCKWRGSLGCDPIVIYVGGAILRVIEIDHLPLDPNFPRGKSHSHPVISETGSCDPSWIIENKELLLGKHFEAMRNLRHSNCHKQPTSGIDVSRGD